jgi:protocatechuate 3,4-dioxygenase beta subunit
VPASRITLALLTLAGSLAAPAAAPAAPADSSVLVIAGPDEPGARMVVTGRMLTRDGRPAPGERVGVYHTDASGQYGTHPTRRSYPPARDARLSGWLVTDAAGRFEIRTIRPGLYPGGGTPAHIHFIVGGSGNYEIRFDDDPVLRRAGRHPAEGSRVQVRPVRKDATGVQRVTVEWRLP